MKSIKIKKISLAFKLNALITCIVLIVSAVLVTICYNMYSQTAYEPIYERMDRIDEELTDKKKDELIAYLDVFDQLLKLDGFGEASEKAAQTGNGEYISDWLSKWSINMEDRKIMPEEEYYKLRSALWDEIAELDLYEDEEIEEWLQSEDRGFPPDLLRYAYSGYSAYYGLAYSLNVSSKAGVSSFSAIAENEVGEFTEFVFVSSGEEPLDTINIERFGRKLDRPEEIDAYNGQKEHKAFLFGDRGMIKILTVEDAGNKLYMIYTNDVRDVREGQKAFLLRSLILVGIMIAASIAISLNILWFTATKPLRKLSNAVDGINVGEDGAGRTFPDLNIRSNDEIGDLYRNIRAMQTRIIENTESITHMTAEKERIDTELTLATRIQSAMLPNVFPPFPDRTEFDIYASMTPAKEVGGDFYDFFLIDDDHLALVIADVSGKGVPAALLMMVSKILIKNSALTGLSPAEVLAQVNRQICSNNPEEMFVTVWLGVLEISTGKLTAANAGHEYPFLKDAQGGFALFKDRHGFVIGGMDNMKYKDYELILQPGAKLFVYTDGVPEAARKDNEQYGTARLSDALNECAGGAPEEILHHIGESVNGFVDSAPQFDDLTMLCLEFRGKIGTPQAKK